MAVQLFYLASIDEVRLDPIAVGTCGERRFAALDRAALGGAEVRKRGSSQERRAKSGDRRFVADHQHGTSGDRHDLVDGCARVRAWLEAAQRNDRAEMIEPKREQLRRLNRARQRRRYDRLWFY